MTDISNKTPV